MKSIHLGILCILISAVSSARALEFFREVEFPARQVFVPEGFDDNDSIQFIVHGEFPNNCFQMGFINTEFDAETNKIFVKLSAYEYNGQCSEFPSPFHQVVHVGLLGKAGSYGIYDKKTGIYLGALTVQKSAANGAGTDEIPYAPLQDAFFNQNNGKTELIMRGDYPWSCLKISDVDVKVQKDVVVVLPKVVRDPSVKCEVGHTPFEEKREVSVKLPAHEFLLHVRTNGGQAINKMVHPLN